MAINLSQATILASEYVEELGKAALDDYILHSGLEIELEDGWIFFYNSSDYLKTGNTSDALAGNGPIFVSRNGQLFEMSAAKDFEAEVSRLLKRGR